jgi:2-oxoglutarate dehydrogenase E2 component (dihydrolipoamide succinyltransferase)
VPTLGESIFEATISKWIKQEGEAVSVGDPLLELETDKVNIEVSAEHAGVLGAISRGEGETVGIGDVLAVINPNGEQPATEQPQPAATEQPQPAATDGQPSQRSSAPTPHQAAQQQPAPAQQAAPPAITPLAQRLAEEHAIDVLQVQGSGPGGRITKEDVMNHLQPPAQQPPPAQEAPPTTPAAPPAQEAPPAARPPQPMPQPAQPEREERQRMSRRRQTIAERLVEAQRTAAMLTTFNEIDMGAVMELRQRRKAHFEERHNIKLGFMSFFTRAVVGALKAFPLLNAEIQGHEIVIKHYYDIGVAVGTEQGLVVPVLRDADRKSFAQIEQGIAELAHRAHENSLSLTDLQGGTFSITNGGIYGSLMSTPILNTPQVGILGLHKIEERPIVQHGSVVVRPMMYVALSYDHRIVDGSEAVRFLVRIKALMEEPELLLLEG